VRAFGQPGPHPERVQGPKVRVDSVFDLKPLDFSGGSGTATTRPLTVAARADRLDKVRNRFFLYENEHLCVYTVGMIRSTAESATGRRLDGFVLGIAVDFVAGVLFRLIRTDNDYDSRIPDPWPLIPRPCY
jgi:hypothetical protein